MKKDFAIIKDNFSLTHKFDRPTSSLLLCFLTNPVAPNEIYEQDMWGRALKVETQFCRKK